MRLPDVVHIRRFHHVVEVSPHVKHEVRLGGEGLSAHRTVLSVGNAERLVVTSRLRDGGITRIPNTRHMDGVSTVVPDGSLIVWKIVRADNSDPGDFFF